MNPIAPTALSLGVILLAAMGCAPGFSTYVKPPDEPTCDGTLGTGGVRAIFSRSGCYGCCPAYRITLCGDGTVIYDGKIFVKHPGRYVRMLSPDATRTLLNTLDPFPDGPGPLDEPIGTHQSFAYVMYPRNGQMNWLAERDASGQSSHEIFERATGAQEWTGTRTELAELCKDHD